MQGLLRGGKSQNDLEQHYSGHSVALPDPVLPLPFPVSLLPVFLTCNVRMKIATLRTFSSGRVTSGNAQPAFQGPLWHFPVFLTCNVGMKIGLPRRFSSGRVTLGNCQCAFQALLWHFLFFLIYHIRSRIGLPRTFSSRCVTSGEEKTASVI